MSLTKVDRKLVQIMVDKGLSKTDTQSVMSTLKANGRLTVMLNYLKTILGPTQMRLDEIYCASRQGHQ